MNEHLDHVKAHGGAAMDGEIVRTNTQLTRAVNHALAIQNEYSMVCAVEYLKAHGVHPSTIQRVLLQPDQRRPFTE